MMTTFKWIWLTFMSIAAIIFVSCSSGNIKNQIQQPIITSSSSTKSYGSYLAGRVAHLRKDFDNASDYYIKSLDQDPDNKELISSLYLLLVSQSRIDEAAIYAQKHLKNSPNDNFAYTVIAINQLHSQKYQDSLNTISKFDNPAYTSFIGPLLKAWNYVGLNQPNNALKSLSPLKKEPGFFGIYHFHQGLINDYFNNTRDAQTSYEALINEETAELSLRSIELIGNFYLRTQQPDKAKSLVKGYSNDKNVADILTRLSQNLTSSQIPNKIITTPQHGAAEALFSIAATFRYDDIIDVAHMFTSLAIYQNPDYDLAKLLLADILEDRSMYADANKVYDSIKEESPAYYASQIKKSRNLIKENDYDSAEILLKSLALDYNNAQLYLDLGDVLRLKSDYKEAVKNYQKVIKKSPNANNIWVVYYAMGISFEQSNNWQEAEKALLTAKELSQDHYLVLNYLGYTWLKQNQNIDQAFTMIADAYNQAPDDVNIIDSLGWALYNLGYYGMAEKYLEKASELAPSNPVICDHLGDVYWFSGRRNEARFKWQQALDLKDNSEELDTNTIKTKIKYGIKKSPEIKYDKELIADKIKTLIKDTKQ
ncbi:MAG: tetratricopeptide repeat protein [Alphaproteobacteria bacterium]|nr:tetratricopeptide repeat protein [Alphaproteobacteria bacterium]